MNENLRDPIGRARRAQAERPPLREIDWPDTSGLTAEAAILADCEALVEAGLAAWVEADHDAAAGGKA